MSSADLQQRFSTLRVQSMAVNNPTDVQCVAYDENHLTRLTVGKVVRVAFSGSYT